MSKINNIGLEKNVATKASRIHLAQPLHHQINIRLIQPLQIKWLPRCLGILGILRLSICRFNSRIRSTLSCRPDCQICSPRCNLPSSRLPNIAAKVYTSSNAWLTPCPAVGGITCAASPNTTTQPYPSDIHLSIFGTT
jgi:hypothetical protein